MWKNQEDQILAASSKLDLPDCFGKIENKPASPESELAALFSNCQNDLLQGWEFSFLNLTKLRVASSHRKKNEWGGAATN